MFSSALVMRQRLVSQLFTTKEESDGDFQKPHCLQEAGVHWNGHFDATQFKYRHLFFESDLSAPPICFHAEMWWIAECIS